MTWRPTTRRRRPWRPTTPSSPRRRGPPRWPCRRTGPATAPCGRTCAPRRSSAMRDVYDTLDVHFEVWYGEAQVQARIPAMMERIRAAGVLTESQGALVVEVAEPDDTAPMPPLLLVRSDGGYLYATTDMATIEERVDDLGAEAILYVVDARQSLHFEQVFRAARRAGIAGPEVELEHDPFGTVNGKDGKPMRTRDGGLPGLQDLVDEAVGARHLPAGRERHRFRLRRRGAAADRHHGRRRRPQVRRPGQSPDVRLRLRSRPVRLLRGQDGPVPAVRRRPGPVDPAQRRRTRSRAGPPPRPRGARRAQPDAPAHPPRRRPRQGGRSARTRTTWPSTPTPWRPTSTASTRHATSSASPTPTGSGPGLVWCR